MPFFSSSPILSMFASRALSLMSSPIFLPVVFNSCCRSAGSLSKKRLLMTTPPIALVRGIWLAYLSLEYHCNAIAPKVDVYTVSILPCFAESWVYTSIIESGIGLISDALKKASPSGSPCHNQMRCCFMASIEVSGLVEKKWMKPTSGQPSSSKPLSRKPVSRSGISISRT